MARQTALRRAQLTMSDLQKVLSAFSNVKSTGAGTWKARCPCHDDRKASLCIKMDTATGKVLLHCLAGCNTNDILQAVGLSYGDLQQEKRELQPWERGLIDRYDYIDEDGKYRYSKLRYKSNDEGKVIRYARITGEKCVSGDGNAKHVLFKLPELITAVRSHKTIFYAEGEKDVRTLNRMGFTATTAGSVSDWRLDFAHFFIGAEVVILGDNDQPGRNLVRQIKADLRSAALSVRTVFPSEEEHGDVTDYIEEGHTKEDLLELIGQAEQTYAVWYNGKGCKVNPGLLADTIQKQYCFRTARNPGTDSDILFLYDHGRYKQVSEDETVDIVRRFVPVSCWSQSLFRNVAQLIQYSAGTEDYSKINSCEAVINFRNGLLHTDTWELTPHDSGYFSTIQIHAEYREADAPHWKRFITELCTDEEGNIDVEEVAVMQELSGLIFSPIYGYRLKRAYVLHSPEGNTGKSVYVGVHEHLLGANAFTATDFRKLSSSRWATGTCFGKRLVAVGDQGAGEIKDSSIFKSMTGADAVPAEFKGLQPFSYVFKGVIVLACNQLPYFSDDKGNHLADRLMLLPCRNVIEPEARDHNLIEKLLQERDGILYWSMEGLRRLLANNLRFTPCKASEELMRAYRSSHDTLFDFITTECEITGDKSDYIRRSEFDAAYVQYCQSNGLEPLLKKNIKQRAASLGILCTHLDGYNVYRKIKFADYVKVHDQEPFSI